jgi:predicted Zn-dependent protease
MYSRDEAKAITDKILNMAKADAAEVDLSGGERSGTRWANSTITTNLVQYDRNVSVTLYRGQRSGFASTRDFTDAGLQALVAAADKALEAGREMPTMPELVGAQQYLPVEGASPSVINFGPGQRAQMVKDSIAVSDKIGTDGSGYIPKTDQTQVTANTKGLFAYYRDAQTGFILTCRMKDGSGSGWAGITGCREINQINAAAYTEVAAKKALNSRKPKALEPGRYTVILEPRANARFLSLMTGIFNGGPAAGGGRAGGGGAPAGGGGGRGGGGGGVMAGKNVGDKIFSDLFTLRSDIGNAVLRQSTIGPNNMPAKPVTWVEKGVLKSWANGAGASTNQSLVQEGSELSIEDMVKQTKRGLLVTFFWYIRGVDNATLLNTGMTRDGLFLIENGEIVGPVQNFRWNMSPIVGYNNLDLVGKPVPMHTGESYDGGGTALVPPVRINDFYMTSVSPAV